MERPRLETPRLILRPLAPSDRDECIRVETVSREFFAPWMPASFMSTTAGAFFEAQLARSEECLQNGSGCRLAAFLRSPLAPEGGALVGHFNLSNIVRGVFQNADCGWRVSVDRTGKGYATEALNALLTFAFRPAPRGLGLHRVQANVIPTNAPSLAVAARVGFRREGLAVRMLEIAGEWQDHVMHAKLADEHEPPST